MTRRSLRSVQYAEDDSDDKDDLIGLQRQRKRPRLARVTRRRDSKSSNNSNQDEQFIENNCNGDNGQPSNECHYELRRPQLNANLRKRRNISHRRSLHSLGLEEDLTSYEDDEDEDIGALATSQRHRSSSRDSFPNMLLRRSNRTRKFRYDTLNLSRIEDATILEQGPESPRSGLRHTRRNSVKPELRDLLIAQGKSPDDAENFQPPDIYSSIKSRQRQPKKFFDDDFHDSKEAMVPESDKSPATAIKKEGKDNDSEKVPEENDKEEKKEEKEAEESDGEEDDSEEESSESESDEIHGVKSRYSLRKRRAQPARLVDELKRQTRRSASDVFDRMPAISRRKRVKKTFPQNTASPYQQRERRTYSQGASSTSSDSNNEDDDADEMKFAKRREKSMAKARNRCLPMNLNASELNSHGFANERRKIGTSLADIDPMNIDRTVKFDSVGGHKKHVRALKEMIVFPLMYPEVFQKFHVKPPRGCLFYGPPGTGKTLMARALANECSAEGRKVAFFMRKGADCLSKWVGESERQLRLLFDQAFQMRPSIIFFDEIDGLAPVRSSRQDQIHSSIVSTLLGLMDGLDNRGEVIVIGATNRIDSIDPALRRPGRFDREFPFSLPDKQARRQILSIHTKKWEPTLSENFIEELAEKTSGYCGADIMALCAESTLFALRRRYPQIYSTSDKLKLNVDSIKVTTADFSNAMKNIVPTAQRSASNPARNLTPVIRPLLASTLKNALLQLSKLFPLIKKKSKHIRSTREESNEDSHVTETSESESEFEAEDESSNPQTILPLNGLSLPAPLSNFAFRESKVHRPRLLICGEKGDGHTSHLAPALLYDLEGLPVHVLDIPVLYGTSTRTPEEACAQIFREARRTAPSIVYMPNAPTWWKSTSTTVHQTFKSLLKNVSSNMPVLLVATANCSFKLLPRSLRETFRPHNTKILIMTLSTFDQRLEFFTPLFLQLASKKPLNKERKKLLPVEVLEKVTAPAATELTEKELEKIETQEEATMTNLRLFLRDVLTRLARDRRFKVFLKPVDIEDVPDYNEVIEQPMDLSTMMGKIDRHLYGNVQSFTDDIGLICTNALEYNPERDAEGRAIRHRACLLRDMAHAIIQNELEPSFEKLCNEVIEARKKRNADPLKFAPAKLTTPATVTHNSQAQSTDPRPSKKKPSASSNPYFALVPKRRRHSAWASGIIRKYKKKPRTSEGSEEGNKSDGNAEVEDSALDKEESEEDQKKDQEEKNESGSNASEEGNSNENEDALPEGNKEEDAVECPENVKEDEKLLEQKADQDDEIWSRIDSEDQEDAESAQEVENREEESAKEVENREEESAKEVENREEESAKEVENRKEESAKEVENREEESTNEVEMNREEEREAFSEDRSSESGIEVYPKTPPSPQSPKESSSKEESPNSEKASDNEAGSPCLQDVNEESSLPNSSEAKQELPVTDDSDKDITCTINPCSDQAQCSSMQIDIPPSPDLIIDEHKLKELLYHTVQISSTLRVEDLENLYSTLVRCIYRHQNSYDKTSLIAELADEVNEFMNFFDDERNLSDDSLSSS